MEDHTHHPLFMRPLGAKSLFALDVLAAVVITLVLAAAARSPVEVTVVTLPSWVSYLVVAGIGLPIAVRRRWPVPIFVVVLGASMISMVLGVVREPFTVAALALYQVAVTAPRSRLIPTPAIGVLSAVALGTLVLVGLPQGLPEWWSEGIGMPMLGVAVMGAAWTVGRAVGDRRAYAARAAEQLVERATAEERLRIARELHDVVAHSMGMITVKAAVANHVLGQRPEEAHEALRVIEATSRQALSELRYLLGVLRATSEDEDPVAPAPALNLAGLPDLVDRVRSAGVEVSLDIHGAADLPAGVALSVYRIVQEALTNVVAHAAPTRCRVVVEAGREQARIEISDEGNGAAGLRSDGGHGHGLIGMRERVTLYGGNLSAGPGPEGGFRVTVSLPYQP